MARDGNSIEQVMSAEMGRRTVMRGSLLGAGAFLAGSAWGPITQALAKEVINVPPHAGGFSSGTSSHISFQAIATNADDTVTVPPGYRQQPFALWGEPIVPSGPAFKGDASNTAADQLQQLGMGHDGIAYFQLRDGVLGEASAIGLLAINHEYTIGELLFPDGLAVTTSTTSPFRGITR